MCHVTAHRLAIREELRIQKHVHISLEGGSLHAMHGDRKPARGHLVCCPIRRSHRLFGWCCRAQGDILITKVGAGHSRRNERELRARNHADPLDGDLQLTSRDREDVLGAVGPKRMAFTISSLLSSTIICSTRPRVPFTNSVAISCVE